jgi:hypothetical protein
MIDELNMSTSIASSTTPGHALFTEAARLLATPFAAPRFTAPNKAERSVAIVAPARSVFWNLLCMSAGMNAVHPELFVHHIVQD